MKDYLHKESYARSCRDIEESKSRCCGGRKWSNSTKVEWIFYAAWSRMSKNEFHYGIKFGNHQNDKIFLKSRKSSTILIYWAVMTYAHVPHQALIISNSKKAWAAKSRILQNTRENMSIPGNVFDCQHARRDAWWITQWFKKFDSTSSGDSLRREELRKVGVKNHCNQYIYLAFLEKQRKISLDDSNCLKSMTHHAARIGICTQSESGMTIPSYPSSEMHLGKFPDHTEFQSWELDCELPNRGLLERRRIPHAPCSGSRKSKQPNRCDDLNTPKSITGKDFPDYEKLDLMMESALKRCFDKQTHFRKKISVEEQRAQKDNRFLRGRQIAYLIYEYFRPAGPCDEIQGLSGRCARFQVTRFLPSSDNYGTI